MKIYYNSRLAKILTFLPNFSTMMFFGCVLTEGKWLSKKTIAHEGCHALQYRDVTKVGVPLSVTLFFVTVSYIDIAWWMLLYALIGPLLYYIIYLLEWLVLLFIMGPHGAYRNIGFERQARWVASTWNKPEGERNRYKFLGWWGKMR